MFNFSYCMSNVECDSVLFDPLPLLNYYISLLLRDADKFWNMLRDIFLLQWHKRTIKTNDQTDVSSK